MIDPGLLVSTCKTFRPFGGGSHLTGVPCRITPDMPCGRGSGLAGVNMWTHFLDVQPGTDILDGCGRSAGSDSILYADGDGVQITSDPPNSTYAVVWVESRNADTPDEFLRVYLLRDTY